MCGSRKAKKNLRKCEAKLEFLEGLGGAQTKNPPRGGGMDIFWNIITYHYITLPSIPGLLCKLAFLNLQ